jgi:hypothetical protein
VFNKIIGGKKMYKLETKQYPFLLYRGNFGEDIPLFNKNEFEAIKHKYKVNIALLVLRLLETTGEAKNNIIKQIYILHNAYIETTKRYKK